MYFVDVSGTTVSKTDSMSVSDGTVDTTIATGTHASHSNFTKYIFIDLQGTAGTSDTSAATNSAPTSQDPNSSVSAPTGSISVSTMQSSIQSTATEITFDSTMSSNVMSTSGDATSGDITPSDGENT